MWSTELLAKNDGGQAEQPYDELDNYRDIITGE